MKKITITVNGRETEVSDGLTIRDLLDSMKMKSKMLVVEQNIKIIDKKDYGSTKVQEGDSFEIVGFFGGG